jgi:soluble lytic murein transglycosylase-like protein
MKTFSQPCPRPAARRRNAFAAVIIIALTPSVLKAQVLEIDASGEVTVHDQPEVTSQTGSRAIADLGGRPLTAPTRLPPARADLAEAAASAALSPDLIEAVAWRESRIRAGVVSPAGAVGEMQLMPGTARALGVDPYDTRQNLAGGAAYLSFLLRRYNGDLVRALAAYDAGPGAVDRFGGVPPYKETQAYVAAILERLSQRSSAAAER